MNDSEDIGGDSSASLGVGKKTSVILPDEIELPTPNVEYKGLTEEETGVLQAALTKSFFCNVSRSMYEHHRLMFATLVFLVLRKDMPQKEIEILLNRGKGLSHGVSLSDFDPTLVKPSWLSADIWDSILALSSFDGALEGICAHIAGDPSAWKQWYNSPTPENQQFPVKEGSKTLKNFDKLLLIRCLRPDRFKSAMRISVIQSLSQTNGKRVISLLTTTVKR
ncbi:dynein heavy chain 12, axonemal [Exaiptasia diaphana]|uniref:Uncharacterized protein n=1 Tax=Exaiptasia diaphana TaxID=2652724 RepID=A0A913X5D1_EXADI|nr:dynein heavy chain 12, axonemal [Exaiptasia diaphana]